MFGYVTPCKMEMKIKDYEKFKAYYCGLCNSIKNNFGNLPRLTLNYDMTFLAVLLDALSENKYNFIKFKCIMHPLKKRIMINNNQAIDYAAFCNITLAYYKIMDDVYDNKTMKSKVFSMFLKNYLSKSDIAYNDVMNYTKEKLLLLNTLEADHKDLCIDEQLSIDELSHVFADLTGFIISFYYKTASFKDDLYWLGYNLGKWIYIIDAYDDLEKDIKSDSFNAINSLFNTDKLDFKSFSISIAPRIDFLLSTCAQQCLNYLNRLPLIKNEAILCNILELGLMEKMDKVFNDISEGKSPTSISGSNIP
ncbi:hypothetical protein K2F40_02270 [Clostridium sp. CM028]|uniref:DUF5685 family protein n=1 Tax=unclassified Clostridium TaxID=2614128 RepID=UPI001C0B590B|nr:MULTISPECIES: DUF5685 family protein [unclassified Clostridium]MBU3090784.1 hypothetical protein [Clostridium sp. CF011]MBW9144651.1 hypothetical protein [Clostridium sp. CM027]MBW9147823.1 hypothetical protein [Clostridium sp. CM028]UVE40594.1 hypothetical protein KTC92_15985 [Clostridium sp. CM027]WAG69560.1 DUF5685 family protein [Clostridium sp. CF011]